MALPKRKISKSRRDKRRTHQKLTKQTITTCPDCGEPTLPHHLCSSCGNYKGRNILKIED